MLLPARAFIASAALCLSALLALPVHAAVKGKAWTTRETSARTKPSNLALSLGRVPRDTEVTALATEGKWTQVTDGSETGWILTAALRFAGAESPSSRRELAVEADEQAEPEQPAPVAKPSRRAEAAASPPALVLPEKPAPAAPVQEQQRVERQTVSKPPRKARSAPKRFAASNSELPLIVPTPGLLRSPRQTRLQQRPRSRAAASALPAAPMMSTSARPVLVSAAGAASGSSSSRSRSPVAVGKWIASPRVLGLRESPSFADRMTGSLAEHTSVRVVERWGTWGLVESRRGQRGWVVLAALESPLRPRNR